MKMLLVFADRTLVECCGDAADAFAAIARHNPPASTYFIVLAEPSARSYRRRDASLVFQGSREVAATVRWH